MGERERAMAKLEKIDLKIISELMKNSKTSDRELAERLGISKGAIAKRRIRLEECGIIREYTLIPEFAEVGYQIMAITLLKYGVGVDRERVLEARKKAEEIVKVSPFEMIMGERGMGEGYDGVTISLHKDYGSYLEFKTWLRHWLPVAAVKIGSFLLDLSDPLHYRPLTFSTLAEHLLSL